MNPWLEIPLEDYEAHMSLASIAQAQYLADTFGVLIQRFVPQSVAIVGCSGGNGFDRISPAMVKRVVGIDINPYYIAAARERFHGRFHQLELLCQDFLDEDCSFEPVDLVFAGLVFEYVDYRLGISSIKRFIKPDGYLSAIFQLPSNRVAAVSPSPYVSLNKLNSLIQFVSPEEFERFAGDQGFLICESKRSKLNSGKEFHEVLLTKEKQ